MLRAICTVLLRTLYAAIPKTPNFPWAAVHVCTGFLQVTTLSTKLHSLGFPVIGNTGFFLCSGAQGSVSTPKPSGKMRKKGLLSPPLRVQKKIIRCMANTENKKKNAVSFSNFRDFVNRRRG